MTDILQEYCDSRGVAMRVDRQAGILRGVKVLGLESRNGRTYLPDALAKAASLYEGAKVNVNHPKGNPAAPRDYQDRIGTIRNVSVQPDGLFGDLFFNPKHALAEQLAWDAEHAAENVGFSHNVEARVSRQGERVVVEAITRVQSVDLVADPATTRGLFESADAEDTAALAQSAALTVESLKRDHPELVAALLQEQADAMTRLQTEVERLGLLEAEHRQTALARKIMREYHLPDPDTADPHERMIVSRPFWESLLAASDEPAVRRLVEERARLVQALGDLRPVSLDSRPQSRDQHLVSFAPVTTKTFVEAIT